MQNTPFCMQNTPNERVRLHANVGRLRSNAETMSFVDLSHFLAEQLQIPIVKEDKELRLWCLIAKGYTDPENDYRTTKRSGREARGHQGVGRIGAGCMPRRKSKKSGEAPRWSWAGLSSGLLAPGAQPVQRRPPGKRFPVPSARSRGKFVKRRRRSRVWSATRAEFSSSVSLDLS